jgi:hypothetical protein
MQPRVTTAQKEGDRKCHELLTNDGAEKVTKKRNADKTLKKHQHPITRKVYFSLLVCRKVYAEGLPDKKGDHL